MLLVELFLAFFKIGAVSFGGGYAMISLLQNEAVVVHGWLTSSEFANVVAISNITPGPVAVNMATFVGYQQAGILGSMISTLGVSLPSLLYVLITLRFIEAFKDSKLIDTILRGLRPAVAGLILAASIQIAWPEFFPGVEMLNFASIGRSIEFRSIGLCALALVAMIKFKLSPIKVIIAAFFVGVLMFGLY